jgi:hypothetical protein
VKLVFRSGRPQRFRRHLREVERGHQRDAADDVADQRGQLLKSPRNPCLAISMMEALTAGGKRLAWAMMAAKMKAPASLFPPAAHLTSPRSSTLIIHLFIYFSRYTVQPVDIAGLSSHALQSKRVAYVTLSQLFNTILMPVCRKQ